MANQLCDMCGQPEKAKNYNCPDNSTFICSSCIQKEIGSENEEDDDNDNRNIELPKS